MLAGLTALPLAAVVEGAELLVYLLLLRLELLHLLEVLEVIF